MNRMIHRLAAVLAAACFIFLFSPHAAAQLCSDNEIRVLLSRPAVTDRIDLLLSGPYQIELDSGVVLSLPGDERITVSQHEDSLYLYQGDMTLRAGASLILRRCAPTGDISHGIRILPDRETFYPGTLTLTAGPQLTLILTLATEDYVAGVVPYEMGESFPSEALKAQAICARTYAVSRIGAHEDYDVTDTTQDQVFRGLVPSYRRSRQAVRDTAGLVGTYQGELITCYYSASNGGQTKLVRDVWPERRDWECYAVTDDPYDLENPQSIVRTISLNRHAPLFPAPVREQILLAMEESLSGEGWLLQDDAVVIDTLTQVLPCDPVCEGSREYTKLRLSFTWSGRRVLSEGEAGPLEAAGQITVSIPLFSGAARAMGLTIGSSGNELITVRETESAFCL